MGSFLLFVKSTLQNAHILHFSLTKCCEFKNICVILRPNRIFL